MFTPGAYVIIFTPSYGAFARPEGTADRRRSSPGAERRGQNMLIRLIQEKDYEEVSALVVRTLREVNIRDYPEEYIENDVRALQPANIKER